MFRRVWGNRRNSCVSNYGLVEFYSRKVVDLECLSKSRFIWKDGVEKEVYKGAVSTSSNSMEIIGFQNSIATISSKNWFSRWKVLVTDKDCKISKYLNENYEVHVFDPGHIKKSYKKKLESILPKSYSHLVKRVTAWWMRVLKQSILDAQKRTGVAKINSLTQYTILCAEIKKLFLQKYTFDHYTKPICGFSNCPCFNDDNRHPVVKIKECNMFPTTKCRGLF